MSETEPIHNERDHDLKLLETHRRALQKLLEKQARFGSSLPTADALEIEDRLHEIARIERKLGITTPTNPDHAPKSSPGAPQEVLQFLPYLANRTAQKDSLRDTLRRLNPQAPRPVVCIFHGDEHQAQDMFLERLKRYILPELLGMPKELGITEYAIPWPDRYTTPQSFSNVLPRRIADAVHETAEGTLAELNTRLAAQMTPVMFSTFVLTQDWERHGLEGLRSFLRFWQAWPPMSQAQVVIVCLFLTYQVKREGRFFARRRAQRVNAEMSNVVAALVRESFDGLIYSVLPRLEGVEQSEVEHWARSTETRNICPRDEIIAGIRALYERWEQHERSGAIPMEQLAKELRDLLRIYTTLGREVA